MVRYVSRKGSQPKEKGLGLNYLTPSDFPCRFAHQPGDIERRQNLVVCATWCDDRRWKPVGSSTYQPAQAVEICLMSSIV